jgi:hypothetical protein
MRFEKWQFLNVGSINSFFAPDVGFSLRADDIAERDSTVSRVVYARRSAAAEAREREEREGKVGGAVGAGGGEFPEAIAYRPVGEEFGAIRDFFFALRVVNVSEALEYPSHFSFAIAEWVVESVAGHVFNGSGNSIADVVIPIHDVIDVHGISGVINGVGFESGSESAHIGFSASDFSADLCFEEVGDSDGGENSDNEDDD